MNRGTNNIRESNTKDEPDAYTTDKTKFMSGNKRRKGEFH